MHQQINNDCHDYEAFLELAFEFFNSLYLQALNCSTCIIITSCIQKLSSKIIQDALPQNSYVIMNMP